MSCLSARRVGESLLLDSLLSWTGGKKFSILFTKTPTPEEVLGPVSLML